jgi:hypothetical protein
MTNQQVDLIDRLMSGSIDEEEFRRRFPADVTRGTNFLVDELWNAMRDRDEVAVDQVLFVGFRFKLFDERTTAPLISLLGSDWHHSHENIASVFQKLRDPSTVDALFAATKSRHAYLEYNDSASFAVKCLWALYAIGTEPARERISEVMESDCRDEVKETAANLLNKE